MSRRPPGLFTQSKQRVLLLLAHLNLSEVVQFYLGVILCASVLRGEGFFAACLDVSI